MPISSKTALALIRELRTRAECCTVPEAQKALETAADQISKANTNGYKTLGSHPVARVRRRAAISALQRTVESYAATAKRLRKEATRARVEGKAKESQAKDTQALRLEQDHERLSHALELLHELANGL